MKEVLVPGEGDEDQKVDRKSGVTKVLNVSEKSSNG